MALISAECANEAVTNLILNHLLCNVMNPTHNRAWALMALISAECADEAAVARGVAYLMQRQLPSGAL
jgi:hypothetical protein